MADTIHPHASDSFLALTINGPNGPAILTRMHRSSLPEGEVLIQVLYSAINYKDALALATPAKVVKRYPMIPGIDLSGIVLESSRPEFQVGQLVVATGGGLGESQWGGYSTL